MGKRDTTGPRETAKKSESTWSHSRRTSPNAGSNTKLQAKISKPSSARNPSLTKSETSSSRSPLSWTKSNKLESAMSSALLSKFYFTVFEPFENLVQKQNFQNLIMFLCLALCPAD